MTVKSRPRIYYCGMVNTVGYARRVDAPLLVAAGSNKMTSVVRAMRAAGAGAWLVSMPVIGRASRKRFHPAELVRDSDGVSLFLPTVANRWLRKALAPVTFAWFCAKYVRRHDRVILYNHAFEYMLGLMVLRLRGIRAFLDIEDAPRSDETGLRALLARQIFRPIFRLTDRRKITVSEQLAARLTILEFCTVYGATTSTQTDRATICDTGWEQVKEGAPLRIHFGGTLGEDTGLFLFCDAVRLLAETLPREAGSISFLVTGIGGDAELRSLEESCKGSQVQLVWRKDLDREAFLEEFLSCHAALSLRVPETSYAETTFPSKVVEITGNGLLLITTRASDVPLIFDDSNAVLLDLPTASELAERIKSVLGDPDGMRLRAIRGLRRATEVFDAVSVGKRLVTFLGISPVTCQAP